MYVYKHYTSYGINEEKINAIHVTELNQEMRQLGKQKDFTCVFSWIIRKNTQEVEKPFSH